MPTQEVPDYRTKEVLQSAMTLAQCGIELQSVAVSDTTNDDSSNLLVT